MNNTKKEEKEETEEISKVVPLQLITGGKGGGDWLNNLEIGTIFLVKLKARNIGQNTMVLGQYEIVQKVPNKAVLLYNGLEKNLSWFDPRLFSNSFDLVDVLGISQQQEEENNNG